MNNTNGEKTLSNDRKKSGRRVKLSKSKNVCDSRSSAGGTGGLQSFFRWFRKDDYRLKDPDLDHAEPVPIQQSGPATDRPGPSNKSVIKRGSEITPDAVSQTQSNGTHSSSPSPSPVIDCNNLSKSSSCDSILSTATTGFAFVPPNRYEAIGGLQHNERVINPGPYTDSYKRRVRQLDRTREIDKKYELTLRKKYNLFASLQKHAVEKDATLTRDNQKSMYTDLSLPTATRTALGGEENLDREEYPEVEIRKHRRTVSDSSKDKKAGAYLHVKGKRRAPPPPPLNLDSSSATLTRQNSSSNYGTLSPGSTLSRKKRPAPPPPASPKSPTINEAVSNTSLLEDKEIKAIIEGMPMPRTPELILPIRTTPLPGISEERTPGGLTEEQKQQLIDNIRRIQPPPDDTDPPTPTNAPSTNFMLTNYDVMKLEENFMNTNGTRSPIHDFLYSEAVANNSKPGIPTSPISPRPWYKRPISGIKQQESSLPFKKDIILKTIDKRKNKTKEKDDLPEVGYCRNSLVENGTTGSGSAPRFNLFSKLTEKSDDTKRREKDSEKRKSGIGIPNISELDREAAEIITKEQAQKQAEREQNDEMYFTAPEQLVKRSRSFKNTQDVQEPIDELSCKPKSTRELITKFESSKPKTNKVAVNVSYVPKRDYFGVKQNDAILSPASPVLTKKEIPSQLPSITKTPSDKNLLGLWSCPYCTLENPNWRIICEACERIKPYEKLSILEEPPLRPNYPLKKPVPEVKPQPQNISQEEWDKKTERVLKYFMPKTNPTASNSCSGTPEAPKKSFGQAKMLASPKMGVKSLMNRISPEKINGFKQFNAIPQTNPIPSNQFDDEKLKDTLGSISNTESVLTNVEKNVAKAEPVNIDEVRNARIARFSASLEVKSVEEPIPAPPPKQQTNVKDMDEESLEKEKERLREMIRAMNAKALADKYPVLQKPPSSSGPTKRESPQVQRRNGFISAIPISTKSPNPIRKFSPTMARRQPQNVAEEHPPVTAESYKLGAIKKMIARKAEEPKQTNRLNETKIINREVRFPTLVLPETVTELNESSLVLTNDVQKLRFEAMDELQFQKRSAQNTAKVADEPMTDQQHEKVRQISNQLRSVQGVESFKRTLRYAGSSMNRSNTLAINKLLRNLEFAIAEGAHDRAAILAMDLAKMKVSLSVTRHSPGGSDTGSTGSLTEICIYVNIHDKISRKGPIKVEISGQSSIRQLKTKFAREFGIPIPVQRWLHRGQHLGDDSKSVSEYGLQDTQDLLQLYIVSADAAPDATVNHSNDIPERTSENGPHFSPIEAKILSVSDSDEESSDTQNEKHGDDESNLGATALATIPEDRAPRESENEGWSCPLCTLINPPNRPGCSACSESRPAAYVVPSKYQTVDDNFIPEELKRFIIEDLKRPIAPVQVQMRNLPKETRNDLNRVSSNRKSSDLYNIMHDEAKAGLSDAEASKQACTTTDLLTTRHIQVPEQKNIVLTAFTSPNITRNKYRGVDNFNPNFYGHGSPISPKVDGPVISTASPIVRAVLLKGSTDKPVKFGRNGLAIPEDGIETTNHYTELVNLDAADLIANVDPFDCPICFGHCKQYEGIVLRDCLHSFCKECLVNTINYCEEAEIKCPYMDNVYSCESIVQQREIKALVSKDMYEAHLAKSIRQAESKLDNTFHCKTPNCRGWCIYEDNVNQFKCPVCTIVNCLTCRAIHDGLDCKQYQDRMNSDCDTNIDAKRTKDMLQQMVDKGDALMCPTCQVVMMKKWGCDWLKCSMCKTEICWVTRGPRWGPGGKGDTSGGCRCGVDGKKCHPDCNYCH